MVETASVPKTIEALLAEGQRILAEREHEQQAIKSKQDKERLVCWTLLREKAEEELHDLAKGLPALPPDDFIPDHREYRMTFQPWGKATISVTFAFYDGEWILFRRGHGEIAFKVSTEFTPTYNDSIEPPEFLPWSTSYVETSNLSEAIAVCDRAGAAYIRCLMECEQRGQKAAVTQAKCEELLLSEAERALVLAVRVLIEEID